MILQRWRLAGPARRPSLSSIDAAVCRLPDPLTAAACAGTVALLGVAAFTGHQPGHLGRAAIGAAALRHHAIKAEIPVKNDQKKHRRDRGRAGGRPPVFDTSWYKKQHRHARHMPPG